MSGRAIGTPRTLLAVAVFAVSVASCRSQDGGAAPGSTSPPPYETATVTSSDPFETSVSIEWGEAVDLIEGCRATGVFQLHNRAVLLTLRDGSERKTREPTLDVVIQMALRASERCGMEIAHYTE